MKIREYIEKQPLLFDGAMATYLAEKYPEYRGQVWEQLNLSQPEVVRDIHREYLEAGAMAIKTNTFSANPVDMPGKDQLWKQVIRRGYEIANQAVADFSGEAFVFADIGRIVAEEDVLPIYQDVIDTFLSCGAEYFLLETLVSPEDIQEIARYLKDKKPDSFLAVSFAVSPEGYTQSGFLARNLYQQCDKIPEIDALGFNCLSGPKHMLELLRKLSSMSREKYLTVMPNAGYPTMLENRIYYGKSRKYFGNLLCELALEGASMIGGCCGTSPQDIKNAAEQLKKNALSIQKCMGQRRERQENIQEKEAAPSFGRNNEKNAFARKLFSGEKVLVVELDPPVEPDIDFFMEGAARYKYAGVDAIDIADCPIAKARIDSSILACKLSRELGMTAIPHMTCRDRNINATKALLLGLNVEGINNVLTVTGDPVPMAQRQEIKTVFSYNSAVLARHIQSLNQEVFSENPFLVSCALNVNALNFDAQLNHARKKIANGAGVLFTQPILSERGFENLKRAREELDVKILGGIMPVVSYRNANFMNNEMAGIDVSQEIIRQYEGKDREEGEQLAYEISTKIIDKIEGYIDGYYVITPFKRVDLILRIVGYIRRKERTEEEK